MAPTMKNKKEISTVDEFLSDPKRKARFEKEYSQFLLSEFLIEEMEKNKVSVRKLSDTTGISTSIIQNVKAMKTVNLTLKTIVSLIEPFGYELKIQKGKKSYVLLNDILYSWSSLHIEKASYQI
jgi:hypothetical protein